MTTSATQLLKLLGSGIRPSEPSANSGPAGIAKGLFADLLKQAQDGSLASRLPVTISSEAEALGLHLNEDQLARLVFAADKLETAGVRTALVSMDGHKLLLDVHGRQITARADAQDGLVGGIDGVIDLGDMNDAGVAPDGTNGAQRLRSGAASRLGPPSAALASSTSAMKLLAQLHGATPIAVQTSIET